MARHVSATPVRGASPSHRGSRARIFAAGLLLTALAIAAFLAFSARAAAPVSLGTADDFAVLGGSTVTNTGPSVITGDVGLSPGSSVTGFPPGTIAAGTMHVADGVASQAQSDLTIAYNDAAGRASSGTISADLAGMTLTSGVFTAASSLGLSGDLTLDAQGDPNAVFVFQAGSTLTVGSGSRVLLTNGAQACNVWWQVGSSATIGTNSTFVGNVMALTSISMNTGATLDGRAMARNGAVTLDTNTITRAACVTPAQTTGSTTGTTGSTTGATTGSTTGTTTGTTGSTTGSTTGTTGSTTGSTTGTTGSTTGTTGATTGSTSGTSTGTTGATTGGTTGATTGGTTGATTGGTTGATTGGTTGGTTGSTTSTTGSTTSTTSATPTPTTAGSTTSTPKASHRIARRPTHRTHRGFTG